MADKFRIVWLDPAKEDLREIVYYLLEKAPLVAVGLQDEVDRQLSLLEAFPHISQENLYFPGVFDFKLKGLPYIVAHKIIPETQVIEILAVLHERRNRAEPRRYHF